jgi:hypothetical protein
LKLEAEGSETPRGQGGNWQKMICRECQLELSGYLDGEVTGEVRAAIEGHLADCAGCRAELEALRQVADGVHALPKIQPAPEFLAEVRQKIDAAEDRSWVSRLFLPVWPKVPLEVLGVVVVLLGVTVLVTPHHRPADTAPSGLAYAPGMQETDMQELPADRRFERAKDGADDAVVLGDEPSFGYARVEAESLLAADEESRLASRESGALKERKSLAKKTVEKTAPASGPVVVGKLDAPARVAQPAARAVAAGEGGAGVRVDRVADAIMPDATLADGDRQELAESQVPGYTIVVQARDLAAARSQLDQAATAVNGQVVGWDDATPVARVAIPADQLSLFRERVAQPVGGEISEVRAGTKAVVLGRAQVRKNEGAAVDKLGSERDEVEDTFRGLRSAAEPAPVLAPAPVTTGEYWAAARHREEITNLVLEVRFELALPAVEAVTETEPAETE